MFQSIRKKPRSVRKRYAFWWSLGFTSMVGLLWFVSLQYRMDESFQVNLMEDEQRGAFSRFFSDTKQRFSNIISGSEGAENAATTTESVATTTPILVPTPTATGTQNTRAPFVFSGEAAATGTVRIATSTPE